MSTPHFNARFFFFSLSIVRALTKIKALYILNYVVEVHVKMTSLCIRVDRVNLHLEPNRGQDHFQINTASDHN